MILSNKLRILNQYFDFEINRTPVIKFTFNFEYNANKIEEFKELRRILSNNGSKRVVLF
jgi:hypothetical protein